MKTFYFFQYNNGVLSKIVQNEKDVIYYVAALLNKKGRYPVCIWSVKIKANGVEI